MYAQCVIPCKLLSIQDHLNAGTSHLQIMAVRVQYHGMLLPLMMFKLEVLQFIENYASVNCLPQPAAPRRYNKPARTYLLFTRGKKPVHALHARSGGNVASTHL